MGLSGEGQAAARSVSQRLKAATDELQKLEKLVVSGDCAPRVLSDFRDAVDSIRQTAWAAQQWSELQQQQRDPYSVLGILQEERVRRAAQRATWQRAATYSRPSVSQCPHVSVLLRSD